MNYLELDVIFIKDPKYFVRKLVEQYRYKIQVEIRNDSVVRIYNTGLENFESEQIGIHKFFQGYIAHQMAE